MSALLLIAGVWVLCFVAAVALLSYASDEWDEADDPDAPIHVARRDWERITERRR